MKAALEAAGITLRRTEPGSYRAPCPRCDRGRGDDDFGITIYGDGRAKWHCFRCGWAGAWHPSGPRPERPAKREHIPISEPSNTDDIVARRDKARALWRRSVDPVGSTTERYLRWRGFTGTIPATIRHLPASEKFPATMIAAFALPVEPEPGVLQVIESEIVGCHLTGLAPDGRGKAGDPAKRMIARSLGFPIALSAMNDLLGLAIAEGIESGLSILDATGLGVWCAGSAGRMAALADAVPGYADCVTIAAEADPAGRKGADDLAAALAQRGLRTEMKFLGGDA